VSAQGQAGVLPARCVVLIGEANAKLLRGRIAIARASYRARDSDELDFDTVRRRWRFFAVCYVFIVVCGTRAPPSLPVVYLPAC
jgi:hypothetical protein